MNKLLKVILHAAIGGFGAGLLIIPSGAPITTRTVIYPALGSALTSVLSLLCRYGSPEDRR